MSSPYVGEIRMFAGNFAPVGWAFCNGQTMPISENDVLFNLIGTTFGGDGQETFNLPDLRGRVPIHMGTGAGLSPQILGEISGTESVTVTVTQLPAHTHQILATTSAGSSLSPNGLALAKTPSPYYDVFDPDDPVFPDPMATNTVLTGGSQPHDNLQPFLCINFIISLFGIFPTQN